MNIAGDNSKKKEITESAKRTTIVAGTEIVEERKPSLTKHETGHRQEVL